MKIVTHSGGFHADDVFAVATLLFLYPKAEIVRTRNKEIISGGDLVVDVGSIHDPSIERYDHHQRGGAGVRENGIPYAAFGLVWKKYGGRVAGSSEIATLIEHKIVVPIDAIDNGVDVSKSLYLGVKEYSIADIISSFLPKDNESADQAFEDAVKFAQTILARELESARVESKDKEELRKIAERTTGPVIVLETFMRGKDVLIDFPGILFVIYPGRIAWGDEKWYLKAVKKDSSSFESKKLLPAEWAGKVDEELARVSGVSDALFCHKGRFLAAAVTKEGALALTRKALNN
jgi:uncharacterized UPF0160 family protein